MYGEWDEIIIRDQHPVTRSAGWPAGRLTVCSVIGVARTFKSGLVTYFVCPDEGPREGQVFECAIDPERQDALRTAYITQHGHQPDTY